MTTKAQREQVAVWRQLITIARSNAGHDRALGRNRKAAVWDEVADMCAYYMAAVSRGAVVYVMEELPADWG